MKDGKKNSEYESVFEDRDDPQQDDKGQKSVTCVSFCVDIWVTSLVDLEDA